MSRLSLLPALLLAASAPALAAEPTLLKSPTGKVEVSFSLAEGKRSLAAYFWSFEPPPADRPKRLTWPVLLTMATTPASTALGTDLKKRGFTFVGPTTAYAFMQAMGLVNDHVEGCAARERVERARARFRRPR